MQTWKEGVGLKIWKRGRAADLERGVGLKTWTEGVGLLQTGEEGG